MTREEAIDFLIAGYPDSCYEGLREAFDMAIKELEKPERKCGKWIDARDRCGEFLCSNCHETNINNFYKYCPYCGAEMEEKDG